VVYPTHTVVRRRVIAHACDRLDAWKRCHIRHGTIKASAEAIEELRSVCASYAGHFSHADSWNLRRLFRARYPWLRQALRP
jgi:hypothetical protein